MRGLLLVMAERRQKESTLAAGMSWCRGGGIKLTTFFVAKASKMAPLADISHPKAGDAECTKKRKSVVDRKIFGLCPHPHGTILRPCSLLLVMKRNVSLSLKPNSMSSAP